MHIRTILLAGAIAGPTLAGSYSSQAATSQATQQAIQAQQAQIDYLKQQLQLMSDKLNQLQVQAAAQPAPVPVAP